MLTPASQPRQPTDLVRRLIAGDASAGDEAVAAAPTCADPALLVVAALVSLDEAHIHRARSQARTARDRQLVTLAEAHLRGDADLFDVLVREHLAEYPDHVLVAWLAAERSRSP